MYFICDPVVYSISICIVTNVVLMLLREQKVFESKLWSPLSVVSSAHATVLVLEDTASHIYSYYYSFLNDYFLYCFRFPEKIQTLEAAMEVTATAIVSASACLGLGDLACTTRRRIRAYLTNNSCRVLSSLLSVNIKSIVNLGWTLYTFLVRTQLIHNHDNH